MAIITKDDKVLVSGANGFIGMWIVRCLLERGYKVRGTVRNANKAKYVESYFGALGYGDKFEITIVEDITKEGAFDEAVQNVDAIVHTASPIHFNIKTADDLLQPAFQGTVGILTSALKYGENVKRIVLTSSCSAIVTPPKVATVFSELDWDEEAERLYKELGDESSMIIWYRLSKTIAEKAAWEFVEKHKSEISWDLTALNPPLVVGPPIQEAASIESVNLSMRMWVGTVTSSKPKSKEELARCETWIDVRDVGLGHVLALETPDAGGERIIIASALGKNGVSNLGMQFLSWDDVFPSFLGLALYKGHPDVEAKKLITYDATKGKRILGITYHSLTETTRAIMDEISRRGW